MAHDYYTNLVKEFLEIQGFFVMTEVQYKGSDGIRDIDIIAVKIKDGKVERLTVGEVTQVVTPERIYKINEEKFEDPNRRKKIYSKTSVLAGN
ncbi:MAG: hypothetical protein Q6363_005570 [Candidatus Njordarchaeota archaeon]